MENPAHLSYTVQTAVLRTDGCDIIPSPYQLAQRPEVTQNKSHPPHAATARMTWSNCERQTLNSTDWKRLCKRKQRWWLSDRTLAGWMRGSGVFRLWVEVHALTETLRGESWRTQQVWLSKHILWSVVRAKTWWHNTRRNGEELKANVGAKNICRQCRNS